VGRVTLGAGTRRAALEVRKRRLLDRLFAFPDFELDQKLARRRHRHHRRSSTPARAGAKVSALVAKPRFQIDTTQPDAPEDDSPSRADERRAARVREEVLERLAGELVDLKEAATEKLGLPEDVADAVRDARLIKSKPARQRQVRLIRNLLRDADWAKVRVKLDTLRLHGVVPEDERVGEEGAWVVRLVGEGDAALAELLHINPRADRGHLRALVKTVQRATANRKEKAELALADAVRRVLRG
jgi:ribosome-associated protein